MQIQCFRLAKTPICDQRSIELQQHVINEQSEWEWIHYCLVISADQAIQVVRQKAPDLAVYAERDLARPMIHDGIADERYRARIAKHLRDWSN